MGRIYEFRLTTTQISGVLVRKKLSAQKVKGDATVKSVREILLEVFELIGSGMQFASLLFIKSIKID